MTSMHNLQVQSQQPQPAPGSFYSLEITGKGIAQIEESKNEIPPGAPVNIAFLGNEDHRQRIAAARRIRECGLEPVPIISARRLGSEQDLDNLLAGLIGEAGPTRFVLVGGDPVTPAGPYADSLSLLENGVLQRHGIRHVGIVGYPEGHPKIDADALWRALRWKLAFLKNAGCSVEITTQLCFDADAITRWIAELRSEGIHTLVRIGVPGPANIGTLLRYAKQFGVVTSDEHLRKYSHSFTALHQHVTPDRFLAQLAHSMRGRNLGSTLYHLYPFGGIPSGVRWMNRHVSHIGTTIA
ncbi:MAG TPA: hypothetical protein VL356_13935 [Acidocella sp.]|jgi:methylenetetrahydrofolate reductase (NADPH)|nr:hypothetical protein [Acidocella sp.]